MTVAWAFAAALIGAAISAQPAINQAAARVLGAPISAAVISVAVTLAMMLAFMVATGVRPEAAALARLPWWVLLGGAAGFVFVLGGVVVAPAVGAALFFVCLVAGQLAGAALIDQIGAFGMPQRPVSVLRLAGLALVLAGVALVALGARQG